VYKTYGEIIAEERYAPPGFKARLGFKDIHLALGAAEALQVPMPVASLLRDCFLNARLTPMSRHDQRRHQCLQVPQAEGQPDYYVCTASRGVIAV